MKFLHRLGIVFFFLAIVCFAVQHFVYARSKTPMTMGYPWVPVPHWLAYIVGSMLILIALMAATQKYTRGAILLLAGLLFFRAVVTFAPMLVANVRNGSMWTPFSELIAMSGASLFLSGLLADRSPQAVRPHTVGHASTRLGASLFGASLIVFGTQHFIYSHFVATLVPSWIPVRLFWAYFAGIAFLAAAAAILFRRVTQPATALLGLMFCSWVVLVHAPRIFVTPRNGFEWTSGFVALAMSGASWILIALDSCGDAPQPAAKSGAHA